LQQNKKKGESLGRNFDFCFFSKETDQKKQISGNTLGSRLFFNSAANKL
jgi:hypothetical protein